MAGIVVIVCEIGVAAAGMKLLLAVRLASFTVETPETRSALGSISN
jgi:hypothetical protein